MNRLPDDALVVRGGQNFPNNFTRASGATVGADGALQGVSVNAGTGLTIDELAGPNPDTGYPGILNNQIGVTTVGEIRACGGEVEPSPTSANPHHATLSGLTAEQASELFCPTVHNPVRRKP
jgi:hypothetical protein